MLERMFVDGEFVGMHFDEVLAVLEERGVEPTEVDYQECGYIIIGAVYGLSYDIEFDGEWHCDLSYFSDFED